MFQNKAEIAERGLSGQLGSPSGNERRRGCSLLVDGASGKNFVEIEAGVGDGVEALTAGFGQTAAEEFANRGGSGSAE